MSNYLQTAKAFDYTPEELDAFARMGEAKLQEDIAAAMALSQADEKSILISSKAPKPAQLVVPPSQVDILQIYETVNDMLLTMSGTSLADLNGLIDTMILDFGVTRRQFDVLCKTPEFVKFHNLRRARDGHGRIRIDIHSVTYDGVVSHDAKDDHVPVFYCPVCLQARQVPESVDIRCGVFPCEIPKVGFEVMAENNVRLYDRFVHGKGEKEIDDNGLYVKCPGHFDVNELNGSGKIIMTIVEDGSVLRY